ncbi:hypothetical protein INN71_01535 [Nocardioides sp. ChNu-153]|uniref:hypothetical protein n=1 Tax=Nocardioides sp. ChNu-153 TaxID=2779364 RepID=UPI002652E663|nr:hypothetical protein [Nocardioides sp. ChNu-153]MDN7120067.1 hypothetical protein [Nocardioides sp. ChNu-153]
MRDGVRTTGTALVLAAVLAGCGADEGVGRVQPVEPAWVDGVSSEVRVPNGTLEVRMTSVLDEPLQDTDGDGSFVAVSWRLRGPDEVSLTGPPPPLELVLRADGEESVVLAADSLEPDGTGRFPDLVEGGAAVVGVPGDLDVAGVRLDVTADGVTQVLDPWTGRVEAGDAALLYDDAAAAWFPQPCPDLDVLPPATLGDGALLCTLGTVRTTPWTAETGWADPGETWWLVGLSTHMVATDAGPVDGSAERAWVVGRITASEVELAGEAPLAVRPGYQDTTDQFAGTDLTGATYVFADPGTRPRAADEVALRLRQTYDVGSVGELAAPPDLRVDVEVPVGPAVAPPAEDRS